MRDRIARIGAALARDTEEGDFCAIVLEGGCIPWFMGEVDDCNTSFEFQPSDDEDFTMNGYMGSLQRGELVLKVQKWMPIRNGGGSSMFFRTDDCVHVPVGKIRHVIAKADADRQFKLQAPLKPPTCINCATTCIRERKHNNVCDICCKGGEEKDNATAELEDEGANAGDSESKGEEEIQVGDHVRILAQRFGKKWAQGLYRSTWNTKMLDGQAIHFDEGDGVWMCKWEGDPKFYPSDASHLQRVADGEVDDNDLEQLLAGNDQRLGWLRDQASYTGTQWRCPMASCDFDVCITCAGGMDKQPRRCLRDRDKRMIDALMALSVS